MTVGPCRGCPANNCSSVHNERSSCAPRRIQSVQGLLQARRASRSKAAHPSALGRPALVTSAGGGARGFGARGAPLLGAAASSVRGDDAQNPDATARAYNASDDMVNRCPALGGSITGEHGAGELKHRYREPRVGSMELEVMRQIEHAFDPKGILHPGPAI
ncbi:FAD-linked oxidase C-terminal domain-containing protein [Nocardia niigatensis]